MIGNLQHQSGLNIPDPHHLRIILAAAQGAMEGLVTMLQTRSAQLKLGQSVAVVPRQPKHEFTKRNNTKVLYCLPLVFGWTATRPGTSKYL